jgi:hypothetical protein
MCPQTYKSTRKPKAKIMKKTLIGMSLLGIILNPLSAGMLFSPTPETTDTYTLNSNLNGASGPTPINSIDDVITFLESESNYDPAQVSKLGSNIGTVWGIQSGKVFSWTGTDPGAWAEYIVIEDNTTTPATLKLDAVMGSPYQGAPLVENVFAEQIQGSKNVLIDFSVTLADDSSGAGGGASSDKMSTLEIWFKSDPASPQWQECITFVTDSAGGGQTDPNQKAPGNLDQSGGFYAIWDAGTDKPNFQTTTGKIRVLVSYNREEGGGIISGSQWDGYEVQLGATFTANGAMPMIDYPNTAVDFVNAVHQQNLARVGSHNHEGTFFPVYQLSSLQIQNLTGSSGIPDGKYAFGEVLDPVHNTLSPKLIPVN